MSLFVDFVHWQKQSPFAEMRRDLNSDRLADNFGCLLFHLIGKSDIVNRERLKFAYPRHVGLWEWWASTVKEPTYDELLVKCRELDPDDVL